MEVRNLILAALVALLAVAFFKLVFDSQKRDEVAIDEAQLQRALAEYRRSEAQARSAAPRSEPSRTHIVSRPAASNGKAEEPRPRPSVESSVPVVPRRVMETLSPPGQQDDTRDLKTRMDEANRIYDRGDYEGAIDAAYKILETEPDSARMKRIVVSSSCIMGDAETAAKYFVELNSRDKRTMRIRCKRYGVEFDEPQQ